MTTWGGSDETRGEVYVLDNVTGDTGPEKVTYKKIADGRKEPMGIKYVDGKLYVSEKHQLTELSDTKGDNTAGEIRKVAEWPYGGNFHEFAFGLLYEDGHFYLNLSVAINYGGATTDPQPAPNRGTTIKVNKKTGKVSYLVGGLRTPNGIGRGPGASSSSPTTREAGCPPPSCCTSNPAGSSTTTPTRTARSTTARSPSRCSGCRRTR